MAKTKSDGWTDDLLIREIREGGLRRERAWEYIYKAWYPHFLAPIQKKGGTPEQLKQVFGTAVVDVEKQVRKPGFSLSTATLRTYITTALVNAWTKEQGKMSAANSTLEFAPELHAGDSNEAFEEQARKELLNEMIAQLGDDCKKVLTLYREGYQMNEIAEQMGWQGEQSAKNKKRECYKKLLELAKELKP